MTNLLTLNLFLDGLWHISDSVALFHYFVCVFVCVQLTVVTSDKRKMQLVFKTHIIEMADSILLDFRLSRVSIRSLFESENQRPFNVSVYSSVVVACLANRLYATITTVY
jgi:hypothetical protein